MPNFHSLKIASIIQETIDTVSIIFEIPEKLKKSYTFTPGQYITISADLEGETIKRSYSICSSPKEKNIKVAIKAIRKGSFSVFANEQLKEGDYLDISEPEGRFVLETKSNNQNNYIAFVAGSGITPVLSMVKSVLETEKNSTFILVYNNKSATQTIFKKELHDLELKYTGRLLIHFVYSQQKENDALFGRIDKSTVNYFVKNKYSELDFSHHFICGPEAMIDLVYDTLIENNIPENTIKFELFTASTKEATVVENQNSHCEITVLVDDEETTFEMSSKLTILDAALKQGLDVPYSCQGGICSTCMCRITEGTATMKKNSILDESEIEEGIILSCQAVPTSATIKVDFDDV